MTISRPLCCARALALVVMLGVRGTALAQQAIATEQPAAVAANASSGTVASPLDAQRTSGEQTRPPTSRTAMAEHPHAANSTIEPGHAGDRYKSNPHALLDPYQQAVTPPVEGGR
ncbi:hypothetical protein DVT68_14180 [Dyella solisilvae]|uniref:DUF4148 domain-containing protein n=1 Tax=Dyella solisilvae TaxID=1920168 RepID=A0A370K6E4_9GAMM|nr:hypothetical protein [Dyella solisilvae]RDI98219.1 hypothetical protein DVT68_14180 [Dyella solisilvae]